MAIYIVEDDPGVSDSLQFLLQALGHVVFAFEDAESFFEAAPPAAEDTLIVDLGLPGMGGAELIRSVTRRDDAPKVICITGQSIKMIEQSLDGFPQSHLLRKPLSGERLVALL